MLGLGSRNKSTRLRHINRIAAMSKKKNQGVDSANIGITDKIIAKVANKRGSKEFCVNKPGRCKR